MRYMLDHAYNWHGRSSRPCPSARYVDGWGRPGDTTVITIERASGSAPRGIGCSARLRPGYGFIDERTPELTIASSRPAGARGSATSCSAASSSGPRLPAGFESAVRVRRTLDAAGRESRPGKGLNRSPRAQHVDDAPRTPPANA